MEASFKDLKTLLFKIHLLAGGPSWAIPLLGSPDFHWSLLELRGKKMSKRSESCWHAHVFFRKLVPDQLLTYLP